MAMRRMAQQREGGPLPFLADDSDNLEMRSVSTVQQNVTRLTFRDYLNKAIYIPKKTRVTARPSLGPRTSLLYFECLASFVPVLFGD
jgi:hypothetical protein